MSIIIDFEKIDLVIQELTRLNDLGRSELYGPKKIKYLELSILEGEVFEGDYLPATLDISILDGKGGVCEFEQLEEVQDINYAYELCN